MKDTNSVILLFVLRITLQYNSVGRRQDFLEGFKLLISESQQHAHVTVYRRGKMTSCDVVYFVFSRLGRERRTTLEHNNRKESEIFRKAKR